MRTAVLTGTFDPVTAAEITAARKLLQEHNLDGVWLCPVGEGILSLQERQSLLAMAVKPWRHLHTGRPDVVPVTEMDITDGADEERVRAGEFLRAAQGIRRELAVSGYYLEQVVDACCKPRRAAHSRSVAEVCRKLAHAHHLDEKLAWQAGMLHDVTKKWDDDTSRRVVECYYPEMLCYSPKVWHSYTAPVFLKQVLGIRDRKLLHAVECHTLGNGNADLDRILYIADKCEPLRGYDVSAQMNTSMVSLKEGAQMVYDESRRYILETEGFDVKSTGPDTENTVG